MSGFWEKLKGAFGGGSSPASSSPALFAMRIEDVFSITGRGTVVTGRIAAGEIRLGQTVLLRRATGETRPCRVTGIEKFRKILDAAGAGEDVGLLLAGIDKAGVARGDSLSNA